ncbi:MULTISPECIES: VPA1262 family N-terminal domain-containing protein [unclassified Bradyrhizobium]|uniref:VPA1262 family N-terminal domain-containing protein n=1 Tax=unclassified Bradyrhizobium TaxID=2631580 RepID=UPI0029167C13|nr:MULTISPECIES: VPA1262 family N-terminal domain-containing protein [unclassified Bradyrhizobium]
MALAVTIFGLAERSSPGILVYAYLRTIRGSGDYPPPISSRDPFDPVSRRAIVGTELDVVIWDRTFTDTEAAAVLSNLQVGRFSIPAKSPIEPKALIEGQPFGPIVIVEHSTRVRSCGTGLLRASGVAMKDGVARIQRYLQNFMEAGEIAASLPAIFRIIAEESGLDRVYSERRRLGCVELFLRDDSRLSANGPLFNARIEKPNFRNKAPTRQLIIRRDEAPIGEPYRFHVALSNYDELIEERLFEIAGDTDEVVIEAANHITDVELSVFHLDGQLADRISGAFHQGYQFGLTATGRRDILPQVFEGAPHAADLSNRPRIATVAFSGPSAGDRSGGLDILRHNITNTTMLTGADNWKPENKWFRSSGENQVEVIRWIKAKLEQPGVVRAFLADPYLGSDAFRRIIIRHGNETISLAVLVSPGGGDPDVDTLGTPAPSSHLDKLVATAKELSEQLCGRISVYHVKRGDGAKQAFHDRYLCTLNQKGAPTVYLLSNSLSKAAGDWPFAISELDRISSWRVYSYIQALLDGKDRRRAISTSLLRQTTEPATPAPSKATLAQSASSPPIEAWKLAENRFLDELKQVVFNSTTEEAPAAGPVSRLLASWDSETDAVAPANKVFEIVVHRQNVAVYVSSTFAAGTAEQARLSQRLDELLLDAFLAEPPPAGFAQPGHLPFNNRHAYLEHIAGTIARAPSPTDFVRGRLNPIVGFIVDRLEAQRSDQTSCFEQLEAATCAVAVVLEVAIRAEAANRAFRIGMATDHISWMGRLARSETAATRFTIDEDMRDLWRADFFYAASKVAAARGTLGDELAGPIQRVLDDPLVIPAFKTALSSGGSQSARL